VSELKEGRSFGELAIITNKPRAARIIAEDECYFAVMKKADYFRVLTQIEDVKSNLIIDFLKEIPILKRYSRNTLRKLAKAATYCEYKKDYKVLREGSQSDDMFFISTGEFIIERRDTNENKLLSESGLNHNKGEIEKYIRLSCL
jgi:CRP-like cAMP-binding protein